MANRRSGDRVFVDAAFSEAGCKRMRTKRLRRYEAPSLVKRESLPIVAGVIETEVYGTDQ